MNNTYKFAIVGRYKKDNSTYFIKFNKYKTLEFAQQALKDMTKNAYQQNAYELKIVPYFEGYYYTYNLKLDRKSKLTELLNEKG